MRALLEARGASREVIAMAQGLRGFFLADADQLSALVGVELSMQPTDPGHVTLSRIKGGNDRLVQALAKQKGLKIALKAVVTQIDQDDRGVRVHVADGSKKGTIVSRRLPGADDAGGDRARARVHAGGAGHAASRVAGPELGAGHQGACAF